MFLNMFYKSFDSGIFEINRYANVPDETSFIFSVLFFLCSFKLLTQSPFDFAERSNYSRPGMYQLDASRYVS